MTDDKTQRERDLEAAAKLCPDKPIGGGMVLNCDERRAGFLIGAEHGRRDSDAWRAAMHEAANAVRRFHPGDEPIATDNQAIADVLTAFAVKLIGSIAARIESLAGTEPPRTYEDGLREAALKIRGLYNAHTSHESPDMAVAALGEAYDALCAMLSYNPAASTPPATPSADAEERPLQWVSSLCGYVGPAFTGYTPSVMRPCRHCGDSGCQEFKRPFRATPSADVAGERPARSTCVCGNAGLPRMVTPGCVLCQQVNDEWRRSSAATPPEQPRSAAPKCNRCPHPAHPYNACMARNGQTVNPCPCLGSELPADASRAAPPGDAHVLLAELVHFGERLRWDKSPDAAETVGWDDAAQEARAYLASTPEAPPRTAAEPEKP